MKTRLLVLVGLWAVGQGSSGAEGARGAKGARGCVSAGLLEYCTMIDYPVYPNLEIADAEQKAKALGTQGIEQFQALAKARRSTGWEPALGLEFCGEMVKGVICNLLLPPCEDASQRYRKPCKAFAHAMLHGCNFTMAFGDLTFAEPPDCYELPVRSYQESEYADAGSIGASVDADAGSRSEDLMSIAKVLEDAGYPEHAVHMLLQALRHSPDSVEASDKIFRLMHSSEEHLRSLKMQLQILGKDLGERENCAILDEPVDEDFKDHPGLAEPKKAEYILGHAKKLGAKAFFETGTWYGETLNQVKHHFDRIVSVEISAQIADMARQRFAEDKNIEILTGDSIDELPPLLDSRDRSVPSIFWLDGHFSGSRFETAKAELDTPILAELDATLRSIEDHDAILIDDARLFRGYGQCVGNFKSECFPTIDDLRRIVCRHRPSWSFRVEDDMIRIEKSAGKTKKMKGKKGKTQNSKHADTTPSPSLESPKPPQGAKRSAPSFGSSDQSQQCSDPQGCVSSFSVKAPKKQAPRFTTGADSSRQQEEASSFQAKSDSTGAFNIKL